MYPSIGARKSACESRSTLCESSRNSAERPLKTLDHFFLQRPARRAHAHESGLGAAHQAVAEEAVLTRDDELSREFFPNQPRHILESHDAVEGRELDA